QKRE
ncbi:putative membrane protein, partial [Vibrio parahaemolyticus VPCR-2009]